MDNSTPSALDSKNGLPTLSHGSVEVPPSRKERVSVKHEVALWTRLSPLSREIIAPISSLPADLHGTWDGSIV